MYGITMKTEEVSAVTTVQYHATDATSGMLMKTPEREAVRTRPTSMFSHSYHVHIHGGRKALWSFRFGRYSPSRVLSVARWKPREDLHLKEGDKAELSLVGNYPSMQSLLKNQGIL